MKSVHELLNFLESIISVSDVLIDRQLPRHDSVNEVWHVVSRLPSTESSALPDSASNQLERSGCNLFPSCGNSNDGRLTESSVSGFKSVSHNLDVASAVKREFNAPLLLAE